MATTTKTINPADYWKLPNNDFSRIAVGEKKQLAWVLLLDRGIIAPGQEDVTLNRLLKLLERSDRGLLYYDDYSIEELRAFVDGRALRYPSRSRRTKKTVIAMLETADDEPKFERMPDLPAELRVCIYEFYFADLGHATTKLHDGRGKIPLYHHQPPITMVSRLLRQESLDLFYSICSLVLDFRGSTTIMASPLKETSLQSSPCLSMTLNRFKHLQLRVLSGFGAESSLRVHLMLPKLRVRKPVVEICSAWRASDRSVAGRKRSAKAAGKAKRALCGILEAVCGRENGVEWRAKDFEDAGEVLKVLLRDS